VYVDDDVFKRVWDCADQPTRDALDLAYLLGQRPNDVVNLKESNIKDGAVWLRQGKTQVPLRVVIDGVLKALLNRIQLRKSSHPIRSIFILINEKGEHLTYSALRGRFDKARIAAGVSGSEFQIRDLRAKAATEVEQSERGLSGASDLLGHASQQMTKHYVRNKFGKLVKPTK
jgi:integrase